MHLLAQICQTNYTKDLLEWVDAEHLPEWLGGKSKGTLLDDVGPWSDPGKLAMPCTPHHYISRPVACGVVSLVFA